MFKVLLLEFPFIPSSSLLWYTLCCCLHMLHLMFFFLPIPHVLTISHPDLSLPTAICSISSTTAAGAQATVLGGRQILVHSPAVWDEAQAQLKVSGQAAVCSQCQDQQRGDQEETHHQQSHTASISQQV